MRINEFAHRDRPSHAPVYRWIITILVVLLGALSALALAVGLPIPLSMGWSYGWPIWSYTAWLGSLVGCILFLVMRRNGRSNLLAFLTTAGWGSALMSIGMLLIVRHYWNPLMVLGWLIPAIALLIYLMSVGIDLDALFYGDGLRPSQNR